MNSGIDRSQKIRLINDEIPVPMTAILGDMLALLEVQAKEEGWNYTDERAIQILRNNGFDIPFGNGQTTDPSTR